MILSRLALQPSIAAGWLSAGGFGCAVRGGQAFACVPPVRTGLGGNSWKGKQKSSAQKEAQCHHPPPFLTNPANPPPAVTQQLTCLFHPSHRHHLHLLVFDFSEGQHPLGAKTRNLFPFYPGSLAAREGLQLSEVSAPSFTRGVTPSSSGSATPPQCSRKLVPTWSSRCCSAPWQTQFGCCARAKGITL